VRHRRAEVAQRLSLSGAYELWVGSWETALSALTTATQSRTLGMNEAAAHKAAITAERKLVTSEFTLLLGQPRARRAASDDVTFVTAEQL
jgi:hypothetical protein